ncbi:MAG: signal recognition particle-docking protein FtsY [Candidatus Micrarchaeota archaeon]|nr:signal recognition particle-docking protein FtsY [Candidatus Micrarchaeota archaeon]
MFNFIKNKISDFLNKLTKKDEKEEKKQEKQQTAKLEKEEKEEQIKKEEQKIEEKKEQLPKQTEKKEQEKKEESKKEIKELEKLQKVSAKEEIELKPKVGLIKQISSVFSNKIVIEKKDIEELLAELELALVEADVAYDVSKKIVEQIEQKLVNKEIEKKELNKIVKNIIKESLLEILVVEKSEPFEKKIKELIQTEQKPIKILFVGPNGAGKTTTIAKIADRLNRLGYKVVISASDTFRAAAIEQIEEHCNKLGVKLIKSKYGADPAAVAFDAIKYAQTNNYDFVLIDTAGRQNTNINLIDELKKIARVSKPHLKIYVGESIAGNALVEQVQTFKKAIELDWAILTKLDCDPKGGATLSLTYSTKVPIVFFGVGQDYSDLKEFDPNWVIENIIPN